MFYMGGGKAQNGMQIMPFLLDMNFIEYISPKHENNKFDTKFFTAISCFIHGGVSFPVS